MVRQILKAVGGMFSGAGEGAQANAKLQNGAGPSNASAQAGLYNAAGGGLMNAKDVSSSNDGNTGVKGAEGQTASSAASVASNVDGLEGKDNSSGSGKSSAIFSKVGDKMKDGKGKDFMKKMGPILQKVGKAFSDENLKDADVNEDRVENLANVNSYDFTYKPEAQAELGVDGDEHTGVMAQELENNPSYKGCVSIDPESGYKVIDIEKLAMSNTAAISDLARAVEELKAKIGE